MATMPLPLRTGQPAPAILWFASTPGRALLQSEQPAVERALAERPAQPWLWLAPLPPPRPAGRRGLALSPCGDGWHGEVSCRLPLPLPSEAFGTVVVQHVATLDDGGRALLEEAARILVPGGRLVMFLLNPLSPYRWHWLGHGLRASEPLVWRRRLRAAGLQPDAVSDGIGPRWRTEGDLRQQSGAGFRAAYLVRAEKRAMPLTPVRQARVLALPQGASAA